MTRNVLLAYGLVAAGGAVGAMARFALTVLWQRGAVTLPWGTFAANALGCLLVGIVAQLVAHSSWFNQAGWIEDQYRLLFAVGFCGSFTTLSAFVLEVNTLLQRDDVFDAFLYLVMTFVGAFLSFYAGVAIARGLLTSSAS